MTAFHSIDTLRTWLAEFSELHYSTSSEVQAIEQDGAEGADTGLVRVMLAGDSSSAYVQPVAIGSPEWVVTVEAREEPLTLTPSDLMNLANELTTLSALCAYLQCQSLAALQEDQG